MDELRCIPLVSEFIPPMSHQEAEYKIDVFFFPFQ